MAYKIITVYNSINYGSFLQAYALCNTLLELTNGSDVSFYNTHSRKPGKLYLKKLIYCCKTLNFKRAKFETMLYCGYLKNSKMLNVVERVNANDCVVTGSDEIWNIHKKDFLDYPVFWGEGIQCKKLIAYAVSSNVTTLEEMRKACYPEKAVQHYNCILFRDKATGDVISELNSECRKKMNEVLDPTFLVQWEKLAKPLQGISISEPYILVYAYTGHFTDDEIKLFKNFAKQENMKIVSVGFYHKWCDVNLPVEPMMFYSVMKKAEFVVTATFHGTVFSILAQRKFLSVKRNSKKIDDLLHKFGLDSRGVESCNDESIIDKIKDEIDYDAVNREIKIERDRSIDALRRAIEE